MTSRAISFVKRLLFPQFCLHCGEEIDLPLCPGCLQQLQMLPPPVVSCNADVCIAPFDHFGPALSILKQFKSGKQPGLAAALAGWMAIALLKADLPPFDLIVPVPSPRLRILQIGYDPVRLLAEELAKILTVPCRLLLRRSGLFLRQENAQPKERKKLSAKTFSWKKEMDISNKRILLIDDFAITGATLRAAKRRLLEQTPSHVAALTFTKDTLFLQ